MANGYEIIAHYFPQWHVDPLNELYWGRPWSEWEVLQKAVPRFPGHAQPKVPLWGYLDESDPDVSQKQIDAAADHGVDAFLYCWYWDWWSGRPAAELEKYADTPAALLTGPFLHRALENGFLRAKNRDRLKFALMWANHNPITRRSFDAMTDYIVKHYLHENNYWTVMGGLYFCIYELQNLIANLGGLPEAKDALDSFRAKVKDAGLPPLHIAALSRWFYDLMGRSVNELAEYFGVDSITSYTVLDNLPLTVFPATDFGEYIKGVPALWEELAAKCGSVPYFPNVTVGFDATPRIPLDQPFVHGAYPYVPVLTNNKPELFEKSLRQAKEFVDTHGTDPKIITIYNWNEWSEGGYLEPDTVHGMGYLEAIRRVFGPR